MNSRGYVSTTYPFFYSALSLRTACGIPSGPTFTVICPFFSFTPAHGYRPSVPSIAFILQIRSESFSEACLLRNVPGTLRTIGLHIKNYSVRSTAQKIDLLPDRLTTYRNRSGWSDWLPMALHRSDTYRCTTRCQYIHPLIPATHVRIRVHRFYRYG